MTALAALLVLPAYAVASILTWRQLRPGTAAAEGEAAGLAASMPLIAAALGLLLHAILLARATSSHGALSVTDTLSLTGVLMAAVGLWLLTRPGLRGLAVMLLPLAGLMALATGWAGDATTSQAYAWTTRTHIALSLVAWTTLTLGAGLSILMAIQHQRLRTRRLGGGLGGITNLLPPLDVTERALFSTITIGFLLLSLSILSGIMFIENVFAQHLAHKTVLSIVAWLTFGILLLGRWRFGWRGHVALGWTIGGYLSLALAYFGSRIILEFLLHQRWG
ncbi:MAG: cytochrome c biogenesis protein CcsA [Pseudomonadota bacterium]